MNATADYINYSAGIEPTIVWSDHFREQPPYRTIRPNGREDWLLTFTLRGRGLYQQPGLDREVLPGDLALLSPSAYQDYGCSGNCNWEFLWAHFMPRPTWMRLLAWPQTGRGLYFLHLDKPEVRVSVGRALRRCRAYLHAGGILRDELALSALEEVLLLAARESFAELQERRRTPEICRAVERMAGALSESYTVASLARQARLSPSRFAHRFKAEMGEGVIAYLLRLRLQQAARLLEYSTHPVKEIAARVGFQCPFYFSRQFRRFYQHSPLQWRAQALSRDGRQRVLRKDEV